MTNEIYYMTTLQYHNLSFRSLDIMKTLFEDCIQEYITLDDLYEEMGWTEDLELEKEEDRPQVDEVKSWLKEVNEALLDAKQSEQHTETIKDLNTQYNRES